MMKQPLTYSFLFKILGWLALMISLAGCGTFEVIVESTPVLPAQAALPTLTARATETSAPTEIPPSPTSAPTETATPTLPPVLIYKNDNRLWQIDENDQISPFAASLGQEVIEKLVDISGDGTQFLSRVDDKESGLSDLWFTDLSNGTSYNLTQSAERHEEHGNFWPARPETVVFFSLPASEYGPINGHLSVIQKDGSDYRVLESQNSLGTFALSPDGQTIAYDSSGQPALYHWGVGTEILNPAEFGLDPELKFGSAAWSPDNSQVAWMVYSSDSPAAVCIMDLASKTARLLHPSVPAARGGWFSAPSWSLDGRWLIVDDTGTQTYGLWYIDLLNGDQEGKLWETGAFPVWSMDGRWLVIRGGFQILKFDTQDWSHRELPIPERSIPLIWLEY